ncbi:hypothetical protein [Streptomyces fractus]|uniref:hypothetical protein n=1 Tax=Streptomyces fractus TaxID=641806 RepID=UPI003CF405FA
MRRRTTTGCFVLLITPLGLLAYFWYSAWHTGRVNSQREQAAEASILQRAHRASDATARALKASRLTAPDALTDAIWQHTHAPVIAYDTSRDTFTATAFWSATYTEAGLVIGGGPITLDRCFALVASRTPAGIWAARLSERDREACSSSRRIGGAVATNSTSTTSRKSSGTSKRP